MSILKLSLVGLASRLVATGLTLATTLVLARWLGPDPTGQYFLFIRVVALLAVFADLGFSQATNVFAGHGESVRQVHGIMMRFAAVSSSVLIAIFVGIMATFGWRVLPNYPRFLQVATVVCIPFLVYSTFWNFLMIGLGQIVAMNAVQVSIAVVNLAGVGVLLGMRSLDLDGAIAVYSAALFLQVVIMLIVATRLARTIPGQRRDGLFGEMWRFGLRGSGGSVSAILWPRIPVFVLNVFHGTAAVGLFSVAQSLVEKMLMPIQAAQEATYRRMAQLDSDRATATMNRYIRVSGWSMLLFFGAGAVVLTIAVITILGPDYRQAVPIILILIPAALMMAVSLLLATFFLAQLGRPGLLSILALINVALIALASFVFIPRYGAMGAAFAVGITQIIGTSVVIVLYLRTTGGHPIDLLRINRGDRDAFVRQLREVMWLRNQE